MAQDDYKKPEKIEVRSPEIEPTAEAEKSVSNQPENALERERPESAVKRPVKKAEAEDQGSAKPAAPVSPLAGGADAPRLRQIEDILSEGLNEIYAQLGAAEKKEFKTAGERTAGEINRILDEAKTKAGKIVELIIKWLSLLPIVNRFFIEQEAKIKTDEILKLKRGGD